MTTVYEVTPLPPPVYEINVTETTYEVVGTNVGPTYELTGVEAIGPQGLPGDARTQFVYSQGVPAVGALIEHNLGRFPGVTVVDSSGRTLGSPPRRYIDSNSVYVGDFSGPFAFTVYLD